MISCRPAVLLPCLDRLYAQFTDVASHRCCGGEPPQPESGQSPLVKSFIDDPFNPVFGTISAVYAILNTMASSSSNVVGVHYRVGKKIGEGSFGVIFEGTNLLNNQQVAIKFVSEILEACWPTSHGKLGTEKE